MNVRFARFVLAHLFYELVLYSNTVWVVLMYMLAFTKSWKIGKETLWMVGIHDTLHGPQVSRTMDYIGESQ